jgi:hypothetical protein
MNFPLQSIDGPSGFSLPVSMETIFPFSITMDGIVNDFATARINDGATAQDKFLGMNRWAREKDECRG